MNTKELKLDQMISKSPFFSNNCIKNNNFPIISCNKNNSKEHCKSLLFYILMLHNSLMSLNLHLMNCPNKMHDSGILHYIIWSLSIFIPSDFTFNQNYITMLLLLHLLLKVLLLLNILRVLKIILILT